MLERHATAELHQGEHEIPTIDYLVSCDRPVSFGQGARFGGICTRLPRLPTHGLRAENQRRDRSHELLMVERLPQKGHRGQALATLAPSPSPVYPQ